MDKFLVTVCIYREDEEQLLHRQPVQPLGPDGLTLHTCRTLRAAQRWTASLIAGLNAPTDAPTTTE